MEPVKAFMELEIDEGLKTSLLYLGISLLLVIGFAATKNVITPDEPVEVGYTEISTECRGIDAGVCIGVERRQHTTYNYNNYTEAEPGTENFYRRIESELMIRAYNTCDHSMSGMEWTSEVEYRNRTASEWMQNENVDLLPCEKTFYRGMEASK